MIFGFEGARVTPDTTQQMFAAAKQDAFQAKGSFTLSVYNFVTERERMVTIIPPLGIASSVLGVVSSLLPVNPVAGVCVLCCCDLFCLHYSISTCNFRFSPTSGL